MALLKLPIRGIVMLIYQFVRNYTSVTLLIGNYNNM